MNLACEVHVSLVFLWSISIFGGLEGQGSGIWRAGIRDLKGRVCAAKTGIPTINAVRLVVSTGWAFAVGHAFNIHDIAGMLKLKGEGIRHTSQENRP